jgi:hypothetical protein
MLQWGWEKDKHRVMSCEPKHEKSAMNISCIGQVFL